MNAGQLIKALKKVPPNTKVLINQELGLVELSYGDVRLQKAYLVWHSDNGCGNGRPYTDFEHEPSDFVYGDHRSKTVGEESVLILG